MYVRRVLRCQVYTRTVGIGKWILKQQRTLSCVIRFDAHILRIFCVGEILSLLFKLGGLLPIILIVLFKISLRLLLFSCAVSRSWVWQLGSFMFLYSAYTVLLLHRIRIKKNCCFLLDHMSVYWKCNIC
jgi:hypothetical protein